MFGSGVCEFTGGLGTGFNGDSYVVRGAQLIPHIVAHFRQDSKALEVILGHIKQGGILLSGRGILNCWANSFIRFLLHLITQGVQGGCTILRNACLLCYSLI